MNLVLPAPLRQIGFLVSVILTLALCAGSAFAQLTTANAKQQLLFAGLRTANQKGQINALAINAAGEIYLAYDQGDGIRILKVSNDGSSLLAEEHLGAAGDVAVALTLDASGNIYIAGSSSSASLMATNNAAIPLGPVSNSRAFVAKFDPGLAELFLTFTRGSKTSATALAASMDSVFVTGVIYSSDLPVTPDSVQQTPATGSLQNGFVEAFSADGTTLEYATYITGAGGDTTPTGIAADAGDDVWIVGSTSATGFPTHAAVVPSMLSMPSGFVLQLTPTGDSIVWSTYVPGTGLSSLALDSTGRTLLISGQVDLGKFPVDKVDRPLVNAKYQVLLTMTLDGSEVIHGTVIAPGDQSEVVAAPGGGAWVGGSFAPGTAAFLPQRALSTIGEAYAVRVTPDIGVDQTARFGGLPVQNQAYTSLPVNVAEIAVDGSGALFLGGAVKPTASAALLGDERYDLPLFPNLSTAFPSSINDAQLTIGTCMGSLCSGSAGYLVKLNPNAAGPALALSMGDLPILTMRNLGSLAAENLVIDTSAGVLRSTCGNTLEAGAECGLLLSGGTAGTITISADKVEERTVPFPAYADASPAENILFSPKEIDFGLQTANDPAVPQLITVINSGSTEIDVAEGLVGTALATAEFSEVSSDCALDNSGIKKILPPGATCHISVAMTASSDTSQDGFVSGAWSIGSSQISLTGFRQAASLTVSASEIDFGTEYVGGPLLPRYFYLSNGSSAAIAHRELSVPPGSPFSLIDECSTLIAANSVCRLQVNYLSSVPPSSDTLMLTTDLGLTVLLSGTTMPPQGLNGSTVNQSLIASPSAVTFADSVQVTGVSASTQSIAVRNTGASPIHLSFVLQGDFVQQTSCPATLLAGASCGVAVRFAPTQPGARQGLLTFQTVAGEPPVIVSLRGTGVPILASDNGSLTFSSTPVGQPRVQYYKILQPFTSLTVASTGPYKVTLVEDQGFGYGAPPLTNYVSAGSGSCHNCWIGIVFEPTKSGTQEGTLTLSSNSAGSAAVFLLSGAGDPDSGLAVTPSVYSFGSIPVGSSSGTSSFILTDLLSSQSNLTITSVKASGDFSVLSGDPDCRGILVFTASCYVSVIFSPQSIGLRSGELTLTTSAGTVAVPLTGTGAAKTGLSINPVSLLFSDPGDAAAAIQSIKVTNNLAGSVLVGLPATATSAFMTTNDCGLLATGESCSIQVRFLAGTQPINDILTIPTTSLGSGGQEFAQTYVVVLTGTLTLASNDLRLTPRSMSYGPVASGTQGVGRLMTLTNLSGKQLSTAIKLPHNYSGSPLNCSSLAPGTSCSFEVDFVPAVNGDLPGRISVTGTPGDGSPDLSIDGFVDGYGVGTGSLAITGGLIVEGVYRFGGVAVGQSSSHTFTLAGSQGSQVQVRKITSAPPFLSATTCGASSPPGENCTVTVTYAPASQGDGTVMSADAGFLVIESDAQSSPDVISLSGQPQYMNGASGPSALITFTLDQGSLSFPALPVGAVSPPQLLTLTNTGTTPIQVFSVTAGSQFAVENRCSRVAAGASCSISVTSTPQTGGNHLDTLEIASNSATSLEFVSLSSVGIQPALTFLPASLDFGAVRLGDALTLGILVTNTSLTPVIFNSATLSGDFTSGGNCPTSGTSLPSEGTCEINVTFAPTVQGERLGKVSLSTSAFLEGSLIPLQGQGISSVLVVTPTAIDFGSLQLGASSTMQVALSNKGLSDILGVTLTLGGGDFHITPSCPGLLPQGTTCTAQVTFTPSAVGARAGILVITTSDPSSPLTVHLSGSGQLQARFTLSVDGGNQATVKVPSGDFATFSLLLTPLGGFRGPVALTCVQEQQIITNSCSLSPAGVLLEQAQTSTITVNTVKSADGRGQLEAAQLRLRGELILASASLCFLLRSRKFQRRYLQSYLRCTLLVFLIVMSGCGGKGVLSSETYTRPGVYGFVITASSTGGEVWSQSVMLTVIVTAR